MSAATTTGKHDRELDRALHLAFSHAGRDIWHVLRWCGQIHMGYWYATDPAGIAGETGDIAKMFDVRSLPAKYTDGLDIEGKDSRPDWEAAPAVWSAHFEAQTLRHFEAIAKAIDDGFDLATISPDKVGQTNV